MTDEDQAQEKPTTSDQLDAAVLQKLLAHLDERKDVQNIDLMNLAGFCRNCLSKWYVEAANNTPEAMDLEAARERVYGMPYAKWKSEHQVEATETQKAEFARKNSGKI